MTPVPARGRRSVTSVLLGVLAMGGSFAVMGALVLSDVADASAPQASQAELVATVEQKAELALPTEPTEPAVLEEPVPVKPQAKRRSKKKVDFGRFEGY
jgi:hypothetical protein